MHILQTTDQERFMQTALKVAFASTDMTTVNQHFGSAKAFAVYGVDREHAQLVEVAQFGDLEQDGNEDKLASKIQLLDGCAAVYCQAVGASAIKQLLAAGVQPVKVHEGSQIKDLLADLQTEINAGPSSWLAKAINKQKAVDPDRFNQMVDEGWQE
jgi:nitrogen fixation protein NifX